jgi:hypothetical protein
MQMLTEDEWVEAYESVVTGAIEPGVPIRPPACWAERAGHARDLVRSLGRTLTWERRPDHRRALARAYARAYRLEIEAAKRSPETLRPPR